MTLDFYGIPGRQKQMQLFSKKPLPIFPFPAHESLYSICSYLCSEKRDMCTWEGGFNLWWYGGFVIEKCFVLCNEEDYTFLHFLPVCF